MSNVLLYAEHALVHQKKINALLALIIIIWKSVNAKLHALQSTIK